HSVDELLNFGKLLLVGLPEFLHHKREPRTRPGFLAQSRDPDTTVLLDDLICFAVITDGRRSAMEWIVGVDQPLFRSEEATEIGDRLALRLDDIIVNRLNEPVFIGHNQSRSAPRVSFQCEALPSIFRRSIAVPGQCSSRLDRNGTDWLAVFEEQANLEIGGYHISWNSHCDRSPIRRERRFDIANGIGNQELETISLRLTGCERQFRRRIPLLCFFPFVLGEGGGVNHPVIEALEGHTARCRIGKDLRRRPIRSSSPVRSQNRTISLKRSLAVG